MRLPVNLHKQKVSIARKKLLKGQPIKKSEKAILKKDTTERKKKIVEGLAFREEAERDRQNAFAEKSTILSQAREEETKLLQAAHEKAESLKGSLIANAEKEAEGIVAKAEGELGRMKKELHSEWQEKSPKLIVDLARKVLGDKFTQDVNETYIKSLVK